MAIALSYAARSNVGLGPKSRNEDSGYAGPHLLVLADGMGGHSAGDVASSMIVGELVPLDLEDVTPERAIPELEAGLARANAKLSAAMDEDPRLAGMGSTTIALLRTGNKLAMAHIGDSRAFLLRGDTFSQVTRDHSYVQHLLDQGDITPEMAHNHPQRSVVTRVMTGSDDDLADTSLREARVGDRFVLCSDGLSDYVSADVIEEVVRDAQSADACAERLVEVALRGSTRDNVTVIVADVVDAQDLPSTEPVVVGAAAKRIPRGPRTRALPVTPAEKAAALSREATGRADESDAADDLADDAALAPGAGSGKAVRRTLGTLLVAALLGGGGYAAYAWSQDQYYVGESGGKVAIYRGVPVALGPVSLSSVAESSDVPVADLPSTVATGLTDTMPARDLTEARSTVNRLRLSASDCVAAKARGQQCGSGAATPVPTITAGTDGTTGPDGTGSPESTGTPSPGSTGSTSTGTPAPGQPGASGGPGTAASGSGQVVPPQIFTVPLGTRTATFTFPGFTAASRVSATVDTDGTAPAPSASIRLTP